QLKMMQDVLGARSRPQREQLMIRIRERPTPADGDQARVANFGKDHAAPLLATGFFIKKNPTAHQYSHAFAG
ncbi:MAG TPA: hypothetical protein VIO36_15835, partial [Anaerolineaceae bacterium]